MNPSKACCLCPSPCHGEGLSSLGWQRLLLNPQTQWRHSPRTPQVQHP